MKPQVSIVKCPSYDRQEVMAAARAAMDLLGGITVFIKPGSSVLVKPNLLIAKEPQYCITTHPEVVRAVVRMLKEINCRVYIGDGPTVFGSQAKGVEEVYAKTGMLEVCQQEEVELVKFDKARWRGKFPLTTWLDKCDYLVSLPKFKTHQMTTLSAGIKNLFGLVSDIYKKELHIRHFHISEFASILVDIYQEAHPALTIVDGVMAMEGDGPGSTGKPRRNDFLLAGSDCVAIDAILASVMGIAPQEVLTTKEGAIRGLGVADIGAISILGERLSDIITGDFKLPTTSVARKIPKPLVRLAKRMIKFYPCVEDDKCIRCATCVKACPNQAVQMRNKGIVFNYARCIRCFCCQEACPASAIRVKKSLLAKILGL
ncbi:MAG: DUF362 domain-containing protein [Candidatus Omnitrophica bacterium]|nr:DUF362 domain-containing protein [Candidatus Omnitrophota bacterium]